MPVMAVIKEDIMTNLDHLIQKHRKLDLEIERIQSRKFEMLSEDERALLHKLKKQKLSVRDQILDLQNKLAA